MGMYSTEKAMKLGLGIAETFKGNALVSALVGMGMGWLIARGTNGSRKATEMKEKITEILEGKQFEAGKKKAEEIAEESRDYFREFGVQAEKWARDFGASAQEQYKKACAGVKEMYEEKPVALAAASAALAALIGVGIWQLLKEKQ